MKQSRVASAVPAFLIAAVAAFAPSPASQPPSGHVCAPLPQAHSDASACTPNINHDGTPLIVDLHGLNITPLQQILFDGATDLAGRYGFIVLAPMGYSVSVGWGGRAGGAPVETAQLKPGGAVR